MIIITLNILISVGKCLRAQERKTQQQKESRGLMDEQTDESAYKPTDAGMDKRFSKICRFTSPNRNTVTSPSVFSGHYIFAQFPNTITLLYLLRTKFWSKELTF